ncbi:MAG: DUF5996 family protein [Desulfovibrionaceae bacterium]|nr:DUF5996 family protein [Desulfovibrionaceae bacterium]
MKVFKYSEWSETAKTLHMILQMIGKVKLSLMPAQPEWRQVLLYPTARGFTSGLMPDGDVSVDISVDLLSSMVEARSIDGKSAGFPLRNGASVSEYHGEFMRMLENVSCRATIFTVPQEVEYTTPFEEQTQKRDYDVEAVKAYFENSVLAYRALLGFAAPYRGKKTLPGLFWGTFDVTTVLFSGLEKPFSGSGKIEKVAFAEQLVEFGFWPGGPEVDDPSFFVLPYPFVERDLGGAGTLSPKEAFYNTAGSQFRLTLKDALRYDNPEAVIRQFCTDAFRIVTKEEKWANLEWLTKPF